ncbi:Nn.00g042400.m01.CDS01 [Neocucurbitaria sp. VM-36]
MHSTSPKYQLVRQKRRYPREEVGEEYRQIKPCLTNWDLLATLSRKTQTKSPLWEPNEAFEYDAHDNTKLSNPGLCARCQRLNFHSIFNPYHCVPRLDGRFVVALDKLLVDENCPTCRLFDAVALKSGHQMPIGYHLRIFPAPKLFESDPYDRGEIPALALTILPGQNKDTLDPWSKRMYPKQGVVLSRRTNIALKTRTVVEGSCVSASRVDYGLLNSWLEQCDSLHVETCALKKEAPKLSVPLRCIDCHTREITQISQTDEYFALSYVWGSSNSMSSEEKATELGKILSEGINQVIEDAIVVVDKLGKRFLWVDQYCVDQHNHNIKNEQIREMDLIYTGAYATIIATAGSSADHGLPGISRPRCELSVSLSGIELHPSFPPLAYAIRDTVWNTRGWTYQEAILSRRCLFFTEQQVYFICPEMKCCEAVTVYRKNKPQRLAPHSGPDAINANTLQGELREPDGPPLRQFMNHVAGYSGRALTYEADILDAFRGILSRAPFYTYYGIPIAPQDHPSHLGDVHSFNIGFARGLFWSPHWSSIPNGRINLTRRPGFPSWSWVGWKGKAMYYDTYWSVIGDGEKFMFVNKNRFDTSFWLEDIDGKRFNLQELALSAVDTKVLPELSCHLIMVASVFRLRFQRDDQVLGACACHCYDPLSREGGVTWRNSALFFQNPVGPSDLTARINTETWDCVLLFESTGGVRNLLIIDWTGEVAHQVGILSIRDFLHEFSGLPFERRRILLT